MLAKGAKKLLGPIAFLLALDQAVNDAQTHGVGYAAANAASPIDFEVAEAATEAVSEAASSAAEKVRDRGTDKVMNDDHGSGVSLADLYAE